MARLRSTKTQRRTVMTLDEVRAVMAAAASIDPAAALMLRIAAVSGARRAELAALQWTDLRDGMLTIDSAIEIVSPRRRQPRAPRRGDEDRQHPHASRSTPTPSPPSRRCAVEREPYGPWMFGLGPELVSPDRIGWWWKRARTLAGIDAQWRLHDLRHWSATVAIGQGHDVRTVAGRLGHANPAMTLRVYAHAFAAADQAVAAGLGDLLKEPPREADGVRPIVVRDEEPPDDTVVVVRGGEMNGDTVRRTATDALRRVRDLHRVGVPRPRRHGRRAVSGPTGAPAVRQGPAHDGWSAASLGFALVPTLDRPHYDVVLPDLADATLDRLELGFDRPIPNPARSGQD